MDISAAIDKFLLQLAADGRSVHTRKQYERHLRLFATWAAEGDHSGVLPQFAVGRSSVRRIGSRICDSFSDHQFYSLG